MRASASTFPAFLSSFAFFLRELTTIDSAILTTLQQLLIRLVYVFPTLLEKQRIRNFSAIAKLFVVLREKETALPELLDQLGMCKADLQHAVAKRGREVEGEIILLVSRHSRCFFLLSIYRLFFSLLYSFLFFFVCLVYPALVLSIAPLRNDLPRLIDSARKPWKNMDSFGRSEREIQLCFLHTSREENRGGWSAFAFAVSISSPRS